MVADSLKKILDSIWTLIVSYKKVFSKKRKGGGKYA
jgi:hypothetical protein